MKKRTKRLAALGLSTMMMASTVMGVQASDINRVANHGAGDVKVEGSGDVDVDGFLRDTKSVDEDYTGSQDPEQSLDDGKSGSGAGESTTWGDESTRDTTQLIITAPTYLSFMAVGTGDSAELVEASSKDDGVKVASGQVVNQSCYVDEDLAVVPKKVDVKAKRSTPEGGKTQFELTKTEGKSYIDGVYLYIGEGDAATGVLYNDLSTEKTLGTLAKGTPANTKWEDGTVHQAVNGSVTSIYFADDAKGTTNITTGFAEDYESNSTLRTDYTLTMTYTVNGNK